MRETKTRPLKHILLHNVKSNMRKIMTTSKFYQLIGGIPLHISVFGKFVYMSILISTTKTIYYFLFIYGLPELISI